MAWYTCQVSAEIIGAPLPPPGPPGDESIVLLCGPAPMITATGKLLTQLAYPKEARVTF